MIKTIKEFIADYNEYYQTNVKVLRCSTLEIEEIMYCLYDCEDFEFDFENDTLELF